MGSYIINFTVYTLAMSGLIFFAFYVYKKVMNGNILPAKNHDMYVEETLNINPRKSLMIVNTGGERFLIASDVDKTTLISKLENEVHVKNDTIIPDKNTDTTPLNATETKEINLEEVNQYIEKLQQESSESSENAVEETKEITDTEAIEVADTTETDEVTNSTEADEVAKESTEPVAQENTQEKNEESDEELNKLYGPVRLEVISNKNPNPIRRKHSYMSKSYSQGKTVTIDVDGKQERALSPIKGIVQKVSNL